MTEATENLKEDTETPTVEDFEEMIESDELSAGDEEDFEDDEEDYDEEYDEDEDPEEEE